MASAAKQRGLSLMTFLFWGLLVAGAALVGIRVVPAYAEYFDVKQAMEKTIVDYDGTNAPAIRREFDLKASAGYIDTVKGTDIEFSRKEGHLAMSLNWSKKLPLFANVSLLLDFDVTVRK